MTVTHYYQQRIENAPVPRRRCAPEARQTLVIVLASALLIGGFLYAIHQHAEAVQQGYKTQQLMRLKEELEREKQQLELQRAYYRSPQVIERMARRLGLVRPDSSQVIIAGADGKLKRWIPPSVHTASASEVHRTDRPARRTVPPWSRRRPTSRRTASAKHDQRPGSRASLAQTRPKRVTDRAPTRPEVPSAYVTSQVERRERPHPSLAGVLLFPEGEAELKLDEKTEKQKKR